MLLLLLLLAPLLGVVVVMVVAAPRRVDAAVGGGAQGAHGRRGWGWGLLQGGGVVVAVVVKLDAAPAIPYGCGRPTAAPMTAAVGRRQLLQCGRLGASASALLRERIWPVNPPASS